LPDAPLADPGVRNYRTGLLGWTRSRYDAGPWFWFVVPIMQVWQLGARQESEASPPRAAVAVRVLAREGFPWMARKARGVR
jgi:hypothetical protein